MPDDDAGSIQIESAGERAAEVTEGMPLHGMSRFEA